MSDWQQQKQELEKLLYVKQHFKQISPFYYNKALRGTISMDGEELNFATMSDGEQQRRDITYNLALAGCISDYMWLSEHGQFVEYRYLSYAIDALKSVLDSKFEALNKTGFTPADLEELELSNDELWYLYNIKCPSYKEDGKYVEKILKPSNFKAVVEKLYPQISIDLSGDMKYFAKLKERESAELIHNMAEATDEQVEALYAPIKFKLTSQKAMI